jgi:hypothetical protein
MADKDQDTVKLEVPANSDLLIRYDRGNNGARVLTVFDKETAEKLATFNPDQTLDLTGKAGNSSIEIEDSLRDKDGNAFIKIKKDDETDVKLNGPYTIIESNPVMDMIKAAYEQFMQDGQEKTINRTQEAFDKELAKGMDPQMAMAVAQAKLKQDGFEIAQDPAHQDQNSIQSPVDMLQGVIKSITNSR